MSRGRPGGATVTGGAARAPAPCPFPGDGLHDGDVAHNPRLRGHSPPARRRATRRRQRRRDDARLPLPRLPLRRLRVDSKARRPEVADASRPPRRHRSLLRLRRRAEADKTLRGCDRRAATVTFGDGGTAAEATCRFDPPSLALPEGIAPPSRGGDRRARVRSRRMVAGNKGARRQRPQLVLLRRMAGLRPSRPRRLVASGPRGPGGVPCTPAAPAGSRRDCRSGGSTAHRDAHLTRTRGARGARSSGGGHRRSEHRPAGDIARRRRRRRVPPRHHDTAVGPVRSSERLAAGEGAGDLSHPWGRRPAADRGAPSSSSPTCADRPVRPGSPDGSACSA